MGLTALKEFIGNGGKVYKPGDSCDEALSWRYTALTAAIGQGLIDDPDNVVRAKFGPEARLAHRQKLASKSGPAATLPVKDDLPASAPSPEEEACRQTRKAGGRVAPPEPVPAPEPSAPEAPPAPPPAEAKLKCSKCDKTFLSPQAVRAHAAKAHA